LKVITQRLIKWCKNYCVVIKILRPSRKTPIMFKAYIKTRGLENVSNGNLWTSTKWQAIVIKTKERTLVWISHTLRKTTRYVEK
jgi:hypothetical protein